jgi:hypothetical protein
VLSYNGQNILQPMFSSATGSIPVDSVVSKSIAVPSDLLPGRAVIELHTVDSTWSGDIVPENNSTTLSFTVSGVPQAVIDVFANQLPILDGDYLGSHPEITLRPRAAILSTGIPSSMRMYVDGSIVSSSTSPLPGSGEIARFEPVLSAGRHLLRAVLIMGTDSVSRTISVNVTDEVSLHNVFNYPNPFARLTDFTFEATGEPEQLVIRVYTVAGRKIREIAGAASQFGIGPGRYKIPWDGRDQDGDDIGNGMYFYQVQATAQGKTVSSIGKMVRVR